MQPSKPGVGLAIAAVGFADGAPLKPFTWPHARGFRTRLRASEHEAEAIAGIRGLGHVKLVPGTAEERQTDQTRTHNRRGSCRDYATVAMVNAWLMM